MGTFVDELPPEPNRGQAEDDYVPTAQRWAAALPRFGRQLDSLGVQFNMGAGVLQHGYLQPVPYAAGLKMIIASQTVEYAGNAYAPNLRELPFVTSGEFEVDKFRLVQGVTRDELAGAGGAALLRHTANINGAELIDLSMLLDGMTVTVEMLGADPSAKRDSSVAFVRAAGLGVQVIASGTYKLDQLPDDMDWRHFSGRGTALIQGKLFTFAYIKSPRYDLEMVKAKIAIASRSHIVANLCVYTNSIGAGAKTVGATDNPINGAGDAIGAGAFAPPGAYAAVLQDLFLDPGISSSVKPVAVWNASYSGRAISSGWFNRNYERAAIRNPAYGAADLVIIGDSINSSYFADPSPTNAALYKVELDKLISKIQGYGSCVVLIGDAPIIAQQGFDYRVIKSALDEIKKGHARDRGLPFFDITSEIAKWYAMNDDLGSISAVPESAPALTQIYQQRVDRTHPIDETHRFIACYLMSKLAPNVWVVGTDDECLQTTDYRWFNQVLGAGAGTEFSGPIQSQHGALLYSKAYAYNASTIWHQALIWCPHKTAALVYRSGSRNGEQAGQRFIGIADAAVIRVKDLVGNNTLKQMKLPNDGVAMAGDVTGVDRPHVICSLVYGLNFVDIRSPTKNLYDYYPGGLQVVANVDAPYPVATGMRSGRDRSTMQKNLLLKSGPIYVSNAGTTGRVTQFASEHPKLANVVHFGQISALTTLLLDIQMDSPTAVSIISGPAWSGPLANPVSLRKVMGCLYRDSLAQLKLVIGTYNYDDSMNFGLLAAGAYTKTGMQKIRVDLSRNAAGDQMIRVYDGWGTDVVIIDFTSSNANPMALEWAGYFGDVWIGPSAQPAALHVSSAVVRFS